MHNHAHYEELCGLAATGQLPETDVDEFRAHWAECSDCRSLLRDFTETGAFLTTFHVVRNGIRSVPDGMTERFVARARSQGMSMTGGTLSPNNRSLGAWRAVAATGIAASLLLGGIFAVKKSQARQPWARTDSPARLKPETSPVPPHPSFSVELEDHVSKLERQLSEAETKMDAMRGQIRSGKSVLDEKKQELAFLQDELRRQQSDNLEVQAKDADFAKKIAILQAEIQNLNSLKTASDIALLADENELRSLRQSLVDTKAALKQEEHLAVISAQAHDLIVARNLHIIDVYDRDGDGNAKRAFGRIFYTEGKSLIFYAYDLTDSRKLNEQVSFYAWGERLGREEPVRRLGIFHNEDKNDGRWVLTFDDPRVLAQINSVFVTVEEEKEPVSRPSGKKILFAFLGNKPNHP